MTQIVLVSDLAKHLLFTNFEDNPIGGEVSIKEIKNQLVSRSDTSEDQKELAWEASAFFYTEEDGVLTEVWAISQRVPYNVLPARKIL